MGMGFMVALGLLWWCDGSIGFTATLGSSDLGQRFGFHSGLCLDLSFWLGLDLVVGSAGFVVVVRRWHSGGFGGFGFI